MNMSLPFFLGRRLSLGADGSKSSPAVKVAIIAVALSVAVMLASIAIVNGFKREIRQRVVGFNSHLTIYVAPNSLAESEQPLVSMTPTLKRILDETPFITNYSMEVSVPSLLKTDEDFKGVYFKGNSNVNKDPFLVDNLSEGNLPENGEDFIIISRKAADRLQLKRGDNINTYFISDDIKVRPLKITGVFNSHFDTYDDIYVYGALGMVQNITGLKRMEGSAIKVMTDDFDRLDEYQHILNSRLQKAYSDGEVYRLYQVESVYNQGINYFQWLSLLDTNVIVVLILMSVVACVTLISGILILILDKINFIGTIKALGASNSIVRKIFVYLAMKVALAGTITGNILMLSLLWLQAKYRFVPLDPDNYYIDFVPVELSWVDFSILNIVILTLIFLVLLLPARFVASIKPSVTLRFE